MMDSEHSTLSSSSEHKDKHRPGPINDEKPHRILELPKLAFIREWRRNTTTEEQTTPPSLDARPDPKTSDVSSAAAMDDCLSTFEYRQYERVRGRQWENRRRARDARLGQYSRTREISLPTERNAQQELSYRTLRERASANNPEQNAEFAEYLAAKAVRRRRSRERESPRDRGSGRSSKRQRRSYGGDQRSGTAGRWQRTPPRPLNPEVDRLGRSI